MADAFRLNAVVSIGTANAVSALRLIDAQGRATAASMGKVVSSAAALTGAVSNLAGLAALARTFSAITTSAAEFEKRLYLIGTVTAKSGQSIDESRKSFREYHDELLRVSAEVGKAPAELAEASFELASSGFEKASENMQILAVAAKAAVAGVTDTKIATSALISVLNSYTMQASEVNHVNDVMFQTVRYGIVQYNDLARYIGNVAPIAASAGISFEEVSASLASITKAGLNASKSTIGLRGAILKLLNNTEKGTETLANYGIEVTAASLAEKGLIATMREINTAIGGDTDVWAKIISDNRALTATLALMRNNGEEAVDFLRKMKDASAGAGAGTEAFLTVAQSFDHTMAKLRAEWGRFIITLGEQYLPIITAVAESTQQFLRTLNNLPDPLKNSAALLLGLVAAGAGINAIVNTIKLAREGLIAYRVEVAKTLAQLEAAEAASDLSGGVASAAKGVSAKASGAVAAGAADAAAAAASAVGGAIEEVAEKAKNVVYAKDLPDVPAIPVSDVLPDPDRMAARAAAQAAAATDSAVIAGSKQLSALSAKNADEVAQLVSLVGTIPEGSADAAKGVAEVGEIVSDELKKSVSAVSGLSAELATIPDGASEVVDAAKSMSGEFAKATASQIDDVESLISLLKDVPDDARLAAIESSEALQSALKNQRDQVNKLFMEVSNFAELAPEGATLVGDPALLAQASKSIEDANKAAVDFSKSIDKLPASAGSAKGALVSMSAGVESAVKKNSDSVGELVEVLAGGFGEVSAKEAEFLRDLAEQADKTGDRIAACGDDVAGLVDLISELPDETAKATKAAKEMAEEIGKAAAKNADDIAILSKNLSEMPGLARDAKEAALRAEVDDLLKGGKAAAGGLDAAGDAAAGAASVKILADGLKGASKNADDLGDGIKKVGEASKRAASGTAKFFPTFTKWFASAKSWILSLPAALMRLPAAIPGALAAVKTFAVGVATSFAGIAVGVGAVLAGVALLFDKFYLQAKIKRHEAEDATIAAASRAQQSVFSTYREYAGKTIEEIKKMKKSSAELEDDSRRLQSNLKRLREDLEEARSDPGVWSQQQLDQQENYIKNVAQMSSKLAGLAEVTKKEEERQAIKDKANAQVRRAYLAYLTEVERKLELYRENVRNGIYATAEEAEAAFKKLPEGGGVEQRDPAKMIPAERKVWEAWIKEKSDIDAQFYTNALENAKLYLAKQDEGIRARREDNRSSLQEELGWYRKAKEEITRLEDEAIKRAGDNRKKQREAHIQFYQLRLSLEKKMADARRYYAKDEIRIMDARIRAMQAEVSLSQHLVKNAMRNNKDLIGTEKEILALMDREYTAKMALIALEEKRNLLAAKAARASAQELAAIATEARIKREDAAAARDEQKVVLQTRKAEKQKAQGDLRVKAIEGQISAIDDAISQLQEVEEGALVNIDAVEKLMKRRLELALDAIEKEKEGALAVAKARQASEEEIKDIILTAEQKKQEAIRDTAGQLRDLQKQADKTARKSHLGEIYFGLDEMLAAEEEQKKERDAEWSSRSRGGSSASVNDELRRIEDQYDKALRDAGISDRSSVRDIVGADTLAADTVKKALPGSASIGSAVAGNPPRGVTPVAGAGGVNLQEVLVNVKFDVNGKVSVSSDALSEGTALAVIDDLAFAEKFSGRSSNYGRSNA